MSAFNTSRFNLPAVTKNLIIINVLIWVVEALFPSFPSFAINGLYRHCALHYVGASDFNPAQIITYMFLHDQRSFIHVFFNMFTLFMFGPILERTWGSKRFFMFYMVCGMGAALVQEGVWALTWEHDYITVGASGAIFGLLLGFAFVFPNMPLYLFFIPIPIKAKWMVIGYGVLEFFLGVSGGGTVAHFAHLGGMLFGLIILLIWRRKGTLHGNGFY